MSQLKSLLIAAALAVAFGSAGCEQRPADTDPPPARPGENTPDTPPPRQPLGERSGQEQPPPGGSPAGASVAASMPAGRARAELMPTEGNDARGTVEFTREGGALAISATLTGLTPGGHGIHVHERGDCSAPDGTSAGEHFAPDGHPHGAPSAGREQHHLGDLGNVVADDSGAAMLSTDDDELELMGDRGVVGRAVIVHAGADDLQTQPDGNSGNPVACGVVASVTDAIDRG
jgi:Cu-Zn family superoxide dismutase